MKAIILWVILIFAPTILMAEDYTTSFLPNGTEYIADRLIVTIQPGVSMLNMEKTVSGITVTGIKSIDYLCERYDVTSIEPFYRAPVKNVNLKALLSRMYIFHVPTGTDIGAACQAFRASNDIDCADIYEVPHTAYWPNDPNLTSQWFLGKIQAYEAWELFRGDATRYGIVGIVDTGIYWAHPDLAPNMWINTAEDINSNGTLDNSDLNGIDDDGNGYVDDVIGWDMGQNDNNPNENSPIHGTFVAGCASEATDNSRQGAGVGFSARIMAVKGANAQNLLTAAYQGMLYAADNGAHVINCSWGSWNYSNTNQNIVNALWDEGIVIVAPAGNNGDSIRFYPAAYDNVLSVAATDSTDHKASFSGYGSWVDISAPGTRLYSTWAQNSMDILDGTSYASAIVSGAIALVKAAHPDMTNDDLVATIIARADNIDTLNPSYAGQLGSGRLNVYRSVPLIWHGNGFISGHVFHDINANGIQDDGELGLAGRIILLRRTDPGNEFNIARMTTETGYYKFDNLEPGNYGIEEVIQVDHGWYKTYPQIDYYLFWNEGDIVDTLDFGNARYNYIQDLQISIGSTRARFHRNLFYTLQYNNIGNTPVINPYIVLDLPALTTYAGSYPGGYYDSIDHSITWNPSALNPDQGGLLYATVMVEAFEGEELTSAASIYPMTGDVNILNNTDTEDNIIVGPHDPNEKHVRPEGYVSTFDSLTYHIDFQNVGTDTAFYVVVKDTLDPHLDLKTFTNMITSHLSTFSIFDRELTWTFPNINLPDSNTNASGSNGFVEFSIRPDSNTSAGTILNNRASVYFDFNTPMVTNTVTNIMAPMPCIYTPGDANGSNTFNGLDVTYSVTYFKGGPPPPYACDCSFHGNWFVSGDVNASCSFNGLDVTYMVSYLKGLGPALNSCPDCPPVGR
jgi:uncharacterized repeat protein (TIGR01451 family)